MPLSQATEFIPLARVQSQLRVDGDLTADTALSTELTDILAAGVGWVEQHTGIPILDRKFRVVLRRPGDRRNYETYPYFAGTWLPSYYAHFVPDQNAPIVVPVRGVRGGASVAYWQAGQTLDEAPTGTVTPGRVEVGDYISGENVADADVLSDRPMLFPPSDGWPTDAEDETPFVVTGNAGFNNASDIPSQFKIAALNMCSALFESPEVADKFENVARSLLEQFTDLGSYQRN